jgi:hypothetical protein
MREGLLRFNTCVFNWPDLMDPASMHFLHPAVPHSNPCIHADYADHQGQHQWVSQQQDVVGC